MRVRVPVLLCCALLSPPLHAADPKPGLWSLEVQMANDPRDQLDPELLEQMGLLGLEIPQAEPARYPICLTPQQVAAREFPPIHDEQSGCAARELRRRGEEVTGALHCDGALQGQGSVDIQLDAVDRYSGTLRFEGVTQEGFPLRTVGRLNGRWLGPDCGAVKPYAP